MLLPTDSPADTISMALNSLRPIVVDDTDSQVRYAGQGWFQGVGSQDKVGNFGPAYNHTSHGTYLNGSFSFNFHGTSISIFGTTNVMNFTGMIDPYWECFVDKINIGATKPVALYENGQTLCEKKGLEDGPHEIMVNIMANPWQAFWFDYLQYTLSPGVCFDTATVMVENSDPGLVFSSGWLPLDGKANMTYMAGSHISFNFTGKLTWLGIIPNTMPRNPSSATFSIDGGFPQSFPLVGLPSATTPNLYNQIFFTTPQLVAGPHVLAVTYTGTTQQTPLTLDHIYVTNTSMPENPVPNSGSIPISSQGSVFVPVLASQPSGGEDLTIASQSPIPTSQLSGKSSSPTGLIVGGIMGSLGLIALVIFLFWWDKRERNNEKGPPRGIARSLREVTPFVSSYTNNWSNITGFGYHASASTSGSGSHVQPSIPVHAQPSLATRKGNGQSSGPALPVYDNEAATQIRATREHAAKLMRQYAIHQDSRARSHQGQSVGDIPPSHVLD